MLLVVHRVRDGKYFSVRKLLHLSIHRRVLGGNIFFKIYESKNYHYCCIASDVACGS